jgi:hypothetical protein
MLSLFALYYKDFAPDAGRQRPLFEKPPGIEDGAGLARRRCRKPRRD